MKRLVIIISFIIIAIPFFGQLIISQTGTVAQWVQNNLVGPGITVSNVTYSGSTQSIGTFTSGTTTGNLGFNNGLVMSTGNVTQLPGFGSAFCSTNVGGGSYSLLAALITQSINDATVLEFDFIPVSDTLKFQYVFGSEEYPEFVNSINDVFGFFVSGLNPFGGSYSDVNVALIPGTNTPITINNVNGNLNSNYYVNNASGTFTKLDGFTTVLTAWLKVIPCVTYHIKIAIGDASDAIYDSGVFFKANSFMSNAVIVDKSTSNLIDTTAVEGCNDAIVTFRIPTPRSTPTYVNYFPSGTATNGVDYDLIPNFVIIPAGLDSINLIIHAILDNLVEPTEYIDLMVSTSPCSYETVRIYIKDNSSPVITLPGDTVICDVGSVNITSSTIGGYAPYTYLWSTGDTSSTILVSPGVTTTYSLKATDLCNNDTTSEMVVYMSSPVFQMQGGEACLGDTAYISVVDTANYTYLWDNGEQTQQIGVSPSATALYTVVVTDSLGCEVTDATTAVIHPLPIVQLSPDTIICLGSSAKLRASGDYNFIWSTGSHSNSTWVSPSTLTVYDVFISDSNACENTGQIEVDVLSVPTAEIFSMNDSICMGNTTTLSGSGGDIYEWSIGSYSQNINVHPVTNNTYTLTVTNISNATHCSHDTSVTVYVKRCNYFYFPSAFTPDGDGLNDGFGVSGAFEAVQYYKLHIYDRWGREIFYTEDPMKFWDGNINGVPVSSDVYTYIVFIQELYIEPYVLKGTVQLIR